MGLEGYSQFATITTEEIFTHFSMENTVKKADKSAKVSKYKLSLAKNSGMCFMFNSVEGCQGKCFFVHKCSDCESKLHCKK